ncbi:MAG: phage tail protein [Desulfobulbus sp.]|nr:phage tail protein [Desulfobulbus sp.]
MSSRLGDISFPELLPESIRKDAQLKAVAASIDGLLWRTAAAIPNLLLWARLDRENQQYLPPLARLIEASGGLKQLSPELLELLAWQLHVDFREAAVTPEQLEAMVRDAIPWHRIKGAPGSIKDALALFGLAAGIEEDGENDYWATYQISLPGIADLETVRLVSRVAVEMQPARCRLYRIYTDIWDTRPGAYSGGFGEADPARGGGFYSEAAYSYYSGVSVPGLPDGGDVIVSFGVLRSATAAKAMAPAWRAGRLRLRSMVALMADSMAYSDARYSDALAVPNHGFVRFRLRARIFDVSRPAAAFVRRTVIRSAQAKVVLPANAVAGILRLFSSSAFPVLPPPARWTGHWDQRRWRGSGAFTNITHEEA